MSKNVLNSLSGPAKLVAAAAIGVSAASAQAALVDFTNNNASQTGAYLPSNPTLVGVDLGSGVTANIQAINNNSLGGNTNFLVDSDNGGLGLRSNGAQLNNNQAFQLDFTNVLLNGQALPNGTTVDFTLNAYLYTDPTGRGFVFDGSANLPSGLVFGADFLPNVNTFDASAFDGGSAAGSTLPGAGGAATVSSLDLAFSTAVNADTLALAPSTAVTFENFLGIRQVNDPNIGGNNDTFYFQGLDITANVVPEPSSLALLGLGGLMMAKRRRRA